jgi:hypothetical protein
MKTRHRARTRAGILVLAAGLVQACSDSPAAAPLASALEPTGELAPSATVGAVVAPGVRLVDGGGRPLAGARVTFEVVAGGGSVAAGTLTADAEGRAIARWTLGTVAGTNELAARLASGESVQFRVTGTADLPAALEALVNPAPVAPAGGLVAVSPSVRVVDRYGNGVPGVPVNFVVQAGGGSVAGPAQVSDETGVATAGGWTTGQPGENVLVATAANLPALSFTTTAVVVSASAGRLVKLDGDGTTCPVGTADCSFTVEVRDGSGRAVPGEVVLWLGPGGGSATTVTNLRGLATSPNIGLRSQAGSFSQSAQLLASGDEVGFNFRLVTAGGFNPEIRFVGDVSAGQRAAFEYARARWQQVITGNLPEFALTGANQVQANACGINHPAVNEVVDDVLIFVEIVPIDGPGKVLGSAGPCMVRGASGLPILGVVRLDRDDLDAMERNGTLRAVVLHELGHVLGLGTLWSRHGLVQGAGTSDPYYTGTRAGSAFILGGGTLVTGVPLENTGGTGTRDGHWRETIFASELMTGFVNTGANPLSRVTVGSLLDMGYQVNFGAADAYVMPGTDFSAQGQFFGERTPLGEVPLPPPLRVW